MPMEFVIIQISSDKDVVYNAILTDTIENSGFQIRVTLSPHLSEQASAVVLDGPAQWKGRLMILENSLHTPLSSWKKDDKIVWTL